MADDVNKKGDKVNGAKIPKAIQEMANKYDRDTDYEASLNDEKLQRLVDKALEYEEKYNSASAGSVQQRTYAMQHGIAEEEAHNYSLTVDQALTAKSNKVLARGLDVYSKSGNINRRTTTMSGQQSYRGAAKTGGGLYRPTNMIESEIQSDIEAASAYGGALADEARSLNVNDSSQGIRERSGKLGEYEERIARNKALLKVQSREGLSTEKLTNRGEDLDRDVGDFLKRKKIEYKINSGDVKSYSEEMGSLNTKREARSAAQADYEKAIEMGSAGVEEFAEKLNKANEALDEQTRVVKGMSDRGDSGGGLFGKYAGHVQFAQMGFQAIGAVAGAANTIAVDQDITQMNNRAQFAKMGNAIYDKADAAVRGNSVDAMLDIIGGDAFAKQYGDANKKFTNVAKGTQSVADTAGGVLGGAAKYAAIGTAAGTAIGAGGGFIFGAGVGAVPGAIAGAKVGTAIGAAAGTVIGLANSIPAVTNVAYGNEGATSAINSYTAAKSLSAEERYIRAKQMQSYYDQGLNTYQTTKGLGSGSQVQNQLMDMDNLKSLAAFGISPEKSVQLSGMLGQAGSMKEKGGFEMMALAGKAGQLGQMNEEEYVSAASRMVAAGGDNSDLENIISAATAKGMDNSKNIGQMVDATLGMSSGLASMGIGGTSAVGGMLQGGTQFLVDQGINKNLATSATAQSMQDYNKAITSQGMTLGNVLERGGLRNIKELQGASSFQMNQIAKMDLSQIEILQQGGPEAVKLMRRLGIDDLGLNKDGKPNKKVTNQIAKEAFGGLLTDSGAIGEKEYDELMSKFGTNQEYSAKARAILADVGGEGAVRIAGGVNNIETKTANVARTGVKGGVLSADRGVDEMAQGKKESGGFDKLETAMNEVSKAIDPAKWGDEVKKAAEGFSIPAGNFLKATGQLEETVKLLIDHQNKMMDKMGEKRPINLQTEAPAQPRKIGPRAP